MRGSPGPFAYAVEGLRPFPAHAGVSRNCAFRGAVLWYANFERGNFDRAIFSWAHLERSNLMYASLRGCDFSGAYLNGAQLSLADLEGAYFHSAFLINAELYYDKVKIAVFTGTVMEESQLSPNQLADVGHFLPSRYSWK
jgi:uncharacterized protein YjbI with pentapeptide repeats